MSHDHHYVGGFVICLVLWRILALGFSSKDTRPNFSRYLGSNAGDYIGMHLCGDTICNGTIFEQCCEGERGNFLHSLFRVDMLDFIE